MPRCPLRPYSSFCYPIIPVHLQASPSWIRSVASQSMLLLVASSGVSRTVSSLPTHTYVYNTPTLTLGTRVFLILLQFWGLATHTGGPPQCSILTQTSCLFFGIGAQLLCVAAIHLKARRISPSGVGMKRNKAMVRSVSLRYSATFLAVFKHLSTPVYIICL